MAPLAEAPKGTAGAALAAHQQGPPGVMAVAGATATSSSSPRSSPSPSPSPSSPSSSSLPYRMLGGVVCFPAHWSLLEKMGMDLATIHDPVPRWRWVGAQLDVYIGKAKHTAVLLTHAHDI